MAKQSKSKMDKPARDFVSTKIKTLMRDFDKTGKIGNSKPSNRGAAQRQAIAVAFSMAQRKGHKVSKGAEDYHNEVLALEEVFDLEEKQFALAQECMAARRHEFSESLDKIFKTFLPLLLEDNPRYNQYLLHNQYMGPSNISANNTGLMNLLMDMAGNPQNYDLDIEPMPLECSRCGARDLALNNQRRGHWGHPEHPGWTLQQAINMGPTTICESCNLHFSQNQGEAHGKGVCIPLYDEITTCEYCNNQDWLGKGVGQRRIVIQNQGEPDFNLDLIGKETWKDMHGKGYCVPLEVINCEDCGGAYTIGPKYNYHDVASFAEFHGSQDDERKLVAIDSLDNDLCWGWKGYKINVTDMKGYARHYIGLEPYEFNALNKDELVSMLIAEHDTTPMAIMDWKRVRNQGENPAPAAPAAPASIEELTPPEIYDLLSKKQGLFENLMNYYHQQHSAEGEERKTNVNLALDEKGFIGTTYPYPANPKSSYTTKIAGGRDVAFRNGDLTVDIIDEREDSVDLIIKGFRGAGTFKDTGEDLQGNRDLIGRVILDLNKTLFQRDDNIWQERVEWDMKNEDLEWDNIHWGAEGRYIGMVSDEENMAIEDLNTNGGFLSVIRVETIIPVVLALTLFSIFSSKNS